MHGLLGHIPGKNTQSPVSAKAHEIHSHPSCLMDCSILESTYMALKLLGMSISELALWIWTKPTTKVRVVKAVEKNGQSTFILSILS